MITQGEAEARPRGRITIGFRADRQQLFAGWNAVANLADRAGTVHVTLEAQSEEGFDSQWLRNAVLEPLEEAKVEFDPEEP